MSVGVLNVRVAQHRSAVLTPLHAPCGSPSLSRALGPREELTRPGSSARKAAAETTRRDSESAAGKVRLQYVAPRQRSPPRSEMAGSEARREERRE